jgi:hypothetical protein
MAICRKCGKSALEIGGYLKRVNKKGVAGIWECFPSCDAKLSPDERLLSAIGEGRLEPEEMSEWESLEDNGGDEQFYGQG